MPKCERKGVELDSIDDNFLQVVGWCCPVDCDFIDCPEYPYEKMSDQEIELTYEATLGATFGDDTIRISHCWTSTAKGKRCPGTIQRTEETRDGDYGNFCPVCGHSLRYHPELGEGKPKDQKKRWSR
jgi:hypothetical protein